MNHEFERYKEEHIAVSRILGQFDENISRIRDPEIRKRLEEVSAMMEDYAPEPPVRDASGEIFEMSGEDMHTKVTKATGLYWPDWVLLESKEHMDLLEDRGYSPEDIEHAVGIRAKEYVLFTVDRDGRRDDLNQLDIVLLPGAAYCDWNSSRAAGMTDLYPTFDELLREIERI